MSDQPYVGNQAPWCCVPLTFGGESADIARLLWLRTPVAGEVRPFVQAPLDKKPKKVLCRKKRCCTRDHFLAKDLVWAKRVRSLISPLCLWWDFMTCYRSVKRKWAAGPGAWRSANSVCWESQLLLVNAGKGHSSKLNDLVVVCECQTFHFVPVEFGYLITGELRLRQTTAECCNVACKCPGKWSLNKCRWKKNTDKTSRHWVRQVLVNNLVSQAEAKK